MQNKSVTFGLGYGCDSNVAQKHSQKDHEVQLWSRTDDVQSLSSMQEMADCPLADKKAKRDPEAKLQCKFRVHTREPLLTSRTQCAPLLCLAPVNKKFTRCTVFSRLNEYWIPANANASRNHECRPKNRLYQQSWYLSAEPVQFSVAFVYCQATLASSRKIDPMQLARADLSNV